MNRAVALPYLGVLLRGSFVDQGDVEVKLYSAGLLKLTEEDGFVATLAIESNFEGVENMHLGNVN